MGHGESTPAVAVVVPAFNEENYIGATLDALREQEFDDVVHREVLCGFRVIVVDNNSTDRTAEIVRTVGARSPVPIEVIDETEAGTGCAADTGFRHAIDAGAVYVARTDADTVPASDWLANLLVPLLAGKRLVGGRVRARTEQGASARVFNAAGHLWRLGHAAEWWRTRHEPDELRRSFAVVGNNLAIDAEMYEQCGGFPRTAIGEADEDQVLQQRVRAIAGARAITLRKQAIVHTSLRRLEAYGTTGFVNWYRSDDRSALGRQADVR
ncbi:glycosyltransferase [Gordonia insulae]|uniref:4,4'-diaponeurosporenoate glycosyltransferase n=1 Tax=Gordonia insulae TaxID=2420509 RepID=A0A3G8JRM6_9ACTN|nr:glycosyltransferase family 2 protein [Gordonia insulae]AZG47375.1 putative glycosyltransferase [Gordonia insulae]